MNDNKTIKVLRILTLTISLMLLVFALAKKVGLCADAGTQTVTSVIPLYTSQTEELHIGSSFPITQSQIDYILQDTANGISLTGLMGIYVNDWTDTYIRVGTIMYYSEGYSWSYNEERGQIDYHTSRPGNPATNYYYKCYPDGSITYDSYSQSGFGHIYLNNVYTNFGATQDLQLKINQNVSYYPIWINPQFMSDGIVTDSTTGQVLIAPYSVQPTGHTKGGVIAEMIENDDIISQDLPQIDTNAPISDTNSNWFQKILNGIGAIGKRIQNGTLTLGFYINQLKDSISDGFNNIIGKLDDVITSIEGNSGDYETVADAWVDCYEDSLIYDFISEFSVVDASLKSLANTSPASSVSFSMGLPSWNVPNVSGSGSSNILANHNSISFNFDWYTAPRYANGDSIRDRIWLVFIPFILVGFMWRLLSKIPSILGGNSGLSEGVHKTIEVSSIYANRTN